MRTKLLLVALLLAGPLHAAAPLAVARSAKGAGASAASDDARAVAAKIDELLAAAQARAKVRPAPLVDDAGFLRRASLDIAGKIPAVNDVRKFLDDSSPEKRAQAVEKLLDSPGYINHFTGIWMDLLIPEAQADFTKRYYFSTRMHNWLRKNFAANTPYDKMVRELVSLPMATNPNMQQFYDPFSGGGDVSPISYYQIKQGKPEDLAASVGRLFLGVRLECAQCHDHPFGKWTREEFWSQAAFFAGMKGPKGDNNFFQPITEVSDRRELTIPNTDRVAQARFLDGKQPRWKFKVSARTTLADWMTAKDNPFLARAIANRMWAHFFGIGIVEPVDDLVDDNPPSHPEVLNLLAKEFVDHDFDLKFLARVITATRAYQLASAQAGPPTDARQFARMPVKGLTAEQLFDSLSVASGYRDNMTAQMRLMQFGNQTPRTQFTERFSDQEKRIEYHTSIPQALTMMNNQLIADATHPDRGQVLGAVTSSGFMSTEKKIEALFLAALSRKPRPEEASRYLKYVEKGGVNDNPKKALADVFWALLNSTEFKFNH
jgi:hypothetical protein